MKNFFTLCFSCFFLLQNTINAQTISGKLDTLLNIKLDSMRKVLKCKSLNAAIQLPNNTIWTGAKGVSSETPLVNANTSHTYLIGSVVKTITSACVLQLADEKKLNLDDKLYQWVDTFKFVDPNITIRQLLRHQSGLYDIFSNTQHQPYLLSNKDSVFSFQKMIKLFIKAPKAQPGTTWDYCNTNYMLLALVIQKATGNPFYVELRNRFFTPLGLTSFKIPAFESLPSSIAHVWIDLNGDGTLDDAHNFYTTWKSLNGQAGPAGGYYATAADVSRWMKKYMRGDLLSTSMMAEAKQTVASMNSTNYGLGLMERNFGSLKAYGHGGDLSYSAASWYFPAKDISITVLNNDSKVISWSLIPVVNELLKVYNKYPNLVENKDFFENKTEMKVFPNPFSDKTTVSIHLKQPVSELQLTVTNILGEKISVLKKYDLSAEVQEINFDNEVHLNKGLYLLTLHLDGKAVKTVKVLKQ
jgi:D-alanyl-D-alanine carboxypeptidase